MIIGYGFRDPHINYVLVRSVMEYGVKFFVIDPQGADIGRAVSPTANALIPGRPTALEDAFVEGCRGASRAMHSTRRLNRESQMCFISTDESHICYAD